VVSWRRAAIQLYGQLNPAVGGVNAASQEPRGPIAGACTEYTVLKTLDFTGL